ncbi:uncharacterized protein LOC119378855 [Rhipicephalus sanguineus]|uniref:uncharacterized protein LOC119378855 n=1 Tax=Rhipicephalus sanguineus TaxID=34632 RepID=UPI00189463C0|nr:uncharacterized protein LOC119378855 [Rhipicephalus sanguineus]
MAVQKMNTILFNELWTKLEKLGRTDNSLMDKNNKTLLHAAAEIGWDYCVAFLLGRSSTDVEQKSRDGRTPVMCAAYEGQTDVVRRLLQAGAHILAEDQSGATAACLAICRRHDATANLLFGKMSAAEKAQYVSRRISLIQYPSASSRDHRCFYRDTLFRVLLFVRRQLEGGTELLLNNDVFVSLVACGRRSRSDPSVVGPLFHLCACLMYDKADYSKYVHADMVEAFMRCGGLDLSRDVLGQEAESCDFQCRCSALLPVLPVAELEEGLCWVREHLDELVRPFHLFGAKKDVLVYWVEGEHVKTNVMWDRFTEAFTRLHLEVRGTPLECDAGAAEGAEPASDPSAPFALLQGGAVKRKSPLQSLKKQNQKTLNKKAPKPRAVQALLQVTFSEDSRMAKTARRVPLSVPKAEEQAAAPPTKPVNVLAVMPMAPTVVPAALPLQGYANALKSNLPKEKPPLHLDETLPPRFKFTGDGTRSPRRKREHVSLSGASMSLEGSFSSQPCIMVTDGGSPSLRRVQSDPALNSPKAKTAAKQKLAFLESNSFGKTVTDEACEMCRTSQAADSPTVPMEAETNSGLRCEKRPINDDSNANQEERVTQIAGQNKDAFAPGQTKRKLGCHRLHYLQEHLFREIIRSRQMKHPEDNRDASSTAMALVETMLRALNSLLQKPVYKANASLDPRIESKPLFTVDSGAVDLYAQTDGKDPQSAEEAFNRELLKADGAWSNSFAYVAAREIAYDDQATLSSVWLAESQRWRKAFLDVANSPLSSLAAVNGFFYSEEKSNFLAGARINERTTVHLGIAKNGREVLLKKIKFHPKDFESALVRVLNFKKLDLYHGNINESHVTWKSSSSLVYVLWHPQDRNLEQYMALLRERKLSLVKWGRVAMGQLLDALAFLHTRREPIVHGRLKPSNILVSPRGTLLLSDLAPPGVLPSIPLGIVSSSYYGSPRRITDLSWRPRELIIAMTKELAAQIFSTASDMQVAGMLIYFMLTGAHPFGKCDDDCQVNIARGRVLARPVNTELDDLAHHLLALEPEYRLTASSAIRHPVFWGPRKRVFFLSAVAVEMEVRKHEWTTEGILRQFNLACGSFNNWTSRVPQGVLKDAFPNIDPPQDALGLLMLIKRCTLDYDTMSPEAQRALKQPERFFVETFPGFLMAVHGVVRRIHWRYSPTIEAFF